MPHPTKSLATLRPDLAGSLMEFDLQASHARFVGLALFPVFETIKASGVFGRIKDAALLQEHNTLRAPGAAYSRSKTNFEDDAFMTRDHGHEEPVDDNEAAMYADYFDAELVAAQRARDVVLRNHERRVVAAATDTGVWTGASLTTAVSQAWTLANAASSTPIANVEAAKLAVFNNSGLQANAVVMSYSRFLGVRNSDEVIDRIKFSGHTDPKPGRITNQVLAEVFGVDFVLVAGGVRNSAAEGLTVVPESIWPDARVQVCRIATTRDIREPCIGRTFHWGEDGSQIGAVVETYRDETVRGDVVRARMQTDEKRLVVKAAHLLTGT